MSSKKYKTCILTSYFTLKPHPQHSDTRNKIIGINQKGFVINDSFEYIEHFYNSSQKTNSDIIIFHDNLSIDFTEKYSSEKLTFVKVGSSEYSNNDYRFLCYLSWLNENKYDNVVMTDLSDVIVAKDPSVINFRDSLCFCRDICRLCEYRFGHISFKDICEDFDLNINDISHELDSYLLNMGVIGASFNIARKFLNLFWEYRLKCGYPITNINMALGNYVARKYFNNIHSGEPFCSDFKKYQTDRKDVYFIHK